MTTTTDVRGQHRAVVRFHRAPPAMRAAFRALEHTAPALGARWAEKIWFRLPVPRDTADRAGAGPPAGARVPIALNGRPVLTERWGDGPVVYLVHGWAGRRADLAAFVTPLVARGYRVIAFDAPSHGGSAPGAFGVRSSSLPEFVTALRAVVAAHGPAHAVVAHSLGAAAAAVAVTQGMPAGRLAMLAPMASTTSYARRFAALLGCGPRIHRRLVARVESRVGAPLHSFEVPDFRDMPATLIVHDADDRSIPVADGSAIAAAWPGARMRTTSGLGHRRLLRDPEVVSEIVDFVTDPRG